MILDLHLLRRNRVQHRLSGPLAQSLLERITPSDITSLKTRHSTLSCLLHPVTGGIVDDTVIARLGPEAFYIVTNAANRDKDLQYLTAQIEEQQAAHSGLTAGISWEVLDDWSLIAVQGPRSGDILSSILDKPEDFDLKSLYFGQCAYLHIRLPSTPGIAEVLVSRGGYTGEDGFEISIPPSLPTIGLIESMLDSAEGKENLRLAGLGARDSLRLEAGMCLYGHDLDDTTTPVEAGLSWIIGKTRRTGGGFHGDQTILSQLKPKKDGGSGVERRRVGFIVDGAPAREGAAIVEADGQVVGTITSGCPSPTLGKNVAMGYVKDGWHKRGTELGVMVRGKKRRAVVTKMPFVESRYWKQAAGTAPG